LQVSTVLFDLDDTLLDSFEARLEAIVQCFEYAGIRHVTAAEFLHSLRLNGGQLEVAFNQLEAQEGRVLKLLEIYRDAYWAKQPDSINLYPGIRNLLQKLRDMGKVLGVVTQKTWSVDASGTWIGAARELNELGILDLFSVGVGFEHVDNYKPDPECVLLAIKELQANPLLTVLVGDSAADIIAGRSAGCWTCQATWGISPEQRNLVGVQADHVVADPDELLKFLILDF
jgi:HAD superfamily hydrolase (TIGR01509 family)